MSHNRVLVIGINPSTNPMLNSKINPSIRRLHDWMTRLGVQYFSFSNAYESTRKLSLFVINLDRLEVLSRDYDRVIALGNYASSALNRIDKQHFKLPHPSGLNRLLNDRDYENRVLIECSEYLR